MTAPRPGPESRSPNQESKRAQIVEAARIVLARDGLAGCTVRTVADAGPLTKSAIHYYFDDIDEIVDRAVSAHLGAMLTELRAVAVRHQDPRTRLDAVLRTYLATFAEKPHAAFLWFEYWIACGRRGTTATVDQMLADVRTLLVELLVEASTAMTTEEADRTAHAVLSWLLGSIVQQHVRPRPPDLAHDELRALIGGL